MARGVFKCAHCNCEVSNSSSATFTFAGLTANLAKDPFMCIECRKIKFSELFSKCEGLLSPDERSWAKVNWQVFVHAWHTAQRDNGERVTDMVNLLLLTGIISHDLAGNWTVKDGINPYNSLGFTLYFTSREDVIAYAALICGNTHYHWSVVQHGEVIGKPDVIAAYKTAAGIALVLVEPRDGHTDAEVEACLRRLRAENINVLAPGFLSAELRREQFHVVEEIAHVEEKREKRLM